MYCFIYCVCSDEEANTLLLPQRGEYYLQYCELTFQLAFDQPILLLLLLLISYIIIIIITIIIIIIIIIIILSLSLVSNAGSP